jgi:hypothetical protein
MYPDANLAWIVALKAGPARAPPDSSGRSTVFTYAPLIDTLTPINSYDAVSPLG